MIDKFLIKDNVTTMSIQNQYKHEFKIIQLKNVITLSIHLQV